MYSPKSTADLRLFESAIAKAKRALLAIERYENVEEPIGDNASVDREFGSFEFVAEAAFVHAYKAARR